MKEVNHVLREFRKIAIAQELKMPSPADTRPSVGRSSTESSAYEYVTYSASNNPGEVTNIFAICIIWVRCFLPTTNKSGAATDLYLAESSCFKRAATVSRINAETSSRNLLEGNFNGKCVQVSVCSQIVI